MKKEHRIAYRSVLELLALGGIKVETALRRIYAITEIIVDGKVTKAKTPTENYHVSAIRKSIWMGLGRCTERSLTA